MVRLRASIWNFSGSAEKQLLDKLINDLILNTLEISMKKLYFICVVIILILSCQSNSGKTELLPSALKSVTEVQWKSLAKKRIYIGYRSVGYNIVRGIQDLNGMDPKMHFRIINAENRPDENKSGIFCSFVRQNASPQVNAHDFITLADSWLKDNIDIAYIRFTPYYGEKNMDVMISDYKKAMAVLKKRFPHTIFIHGTFPLPHVKLSFKTRIKQMVGWKDMWEFGDIIPTNQYNEKLRNAFLGKEPFFDLANFESTFPDGERSRVALGGRDYYQLAPLYARDNIHLNKNGEQFIAAHFLLFLVKLQEN